MVVYQNDHIGTPQKITAVNGAVVWAAKYDSFGKATVDPSSTVENCLRFAGQVQDKEIEFYYNLNRYFILDIGRYNRNDPIGFKGGINTYIYALNNSINNVDPLGLKVFRCSRPLKPGKPGDKIKWYKKVSKLYHVYNCITLPNGKTQCDSTSPGPRWPWNMEPGIPSKPEDDYYHPKACEIIEDDGNDCIENCLLKKWSEERPPYDIGPGVDCQEYSDQTFADCVQQCKNKKP